MSLVYTSIMFNIQREDYYLLYIKKYVKNLDGGFDIWVFYNIDKKNPLILRLLLVSNKKGIKII